jgi:hypothetical protein
MPISPLLLVECFALTIMQPDIVPHPDKSGGKMGDYWTPLKKRCRSALVCFPCPCNVVPRLSDPEFVRSIVQLNVLEVRQRRSQRAALIHL